MLERSTPATERHQILECKWWYTTGGEDVPWNGTPLRIASSEAQSKGNVRLLLDHGADVNARSDSSGHEADSLLASKGLTALGIALEDMHSDRSFSHRKGFSEASCRSITQKGVAGRLPVELTGAIADQLVVALSIDRQSRELVKLLIERGADAKGIASSADLRKVAHFAGGNEDPWGNHLRLVIEGDGKVDEFDPRL